MITAERWLPVVGHPGYEVSDLGRVRGVDRVVVRSNGAPQTIAGHEVLPFPGNTLGHRKVRLADRPRWVHHLVLNAFVGPRPAGMEACHGPGGALDNRLVNLRWGTREDNARDQLRYGTNARMRRTHCPLGHALAAPNLVPSQLARGWRQCLACVRARNYLRSHPDADLREVADRYHEEELRRRSRPSHPPTGGVK